MIYHVAAMSRNRVIGKDNKLPWHFSSDLKHFKNLTTGSTVIMGRKTFESIGKPLPNRQNFVLSSQFKPADEPLFYFSDLEKALQSVKTPNAYIIGGAQVFAESMGLVDGIYLTHIDHDYEGDAFYPHIPEYFTERSRTPLQVEPKIEVIFYEKRKSMALDSERRAAA